MPKERTINQMLALLTRKERTQFLLFLKTETHNYSTKVVALYEGLIKKSPIQKIWEEVFPDTPSPKDPFASVMYRKLEHQLNSYLESYIATRYFLKDKWARDLYVVKALNNRNDGKLFDAKLNKAKRNLEKHRVRDESFFKMKYQLELENQHFLYKQLLKAKESITPALSHSFDTWWLHEKFRLAIANLNHERVTGEKIPNPLFEDILQYVERLPQEDFPALYVYLVLYKTLTHRETDQDLFTIIYTHKDLFTNDALKDIYTTTLNYYSRMLGTSGKGAYYRKIFELYKWGIEDRLVFKDDKLVWGHYKNFMTIGLHLKEYETTLDFIEKYKVFLPEDHREEAYRFSLAHYNFTQHKFTDVIKLLNCKFSNVYYEIQARLLILQSRYELSSDQEDLLRNLRSLRIFIQRQKSLSHSIKEKEILRLRFFEKMIKAYSQDDYEILYQQLSESKAIGNKSWFLQKLERRKSF